MSLTFSSNSTSTDDPCGFTGYHLWLARATLVLIAFIGIMIQWFGWKGYQHFDFKSTQGSRGEGYARGMLLLENYGLSTRVGMRFTPQGKAQRVNN